MPTQFAVLEACCPFAEFRATTGVAKVVRVPASASKADKEAAKAVRTAVAEEALMQGLSALTVTIRGKQEAALRSAQNSAMRTQSYRDQSHRAIRAFPYFIGVWDTVRALGIPAMASGVRAILSGSHRISRSRRSVRTSRYARQALSIDENRRDLSSPTIWDEKDRDGGGIGTPQ